MADIEKTGDWDGFAKMLAEAGSKFKANIKKATDTNGRLIEKKIVQRIASGQVAPPTGAKFKAWKEAHGFSGDTLIMTSSLLNAIKYENKAWNEGFVGVNRNAEQKAAVKREKKITKTKEKMAKAKAKAAAKAAKAPRGKK
jgi:hypothetical protein